MHEKTEEELNEIKQSIKQAKEYLAEDLFTPEDAAQLRRIIAYYEDKLEKELNK